ncbi:pyridoxal phosphate-dependent aminotransferase [Oceanivirga salmonicida]|uniref:pyridoxal phosphate-dependent aminotransferase n=1 Tax=Oceanivirga salmonicida TaxID=1769291 RepID=UPI000830B8FB|nr:aminotransferase class I/II-fold pyridoxal phosphate-dependent enzyme [Oceanivirga salmonicida]
MRKIIEGIEVSKIRQIALKMRDFKDGIDFTIGEPSQDIPQIIKDEMIDKIKNVKIGYSTTGGMIELREKIAKYYNKYFGSNYDMKNCIITIGATEGIAVFCRAVLEENDEVLVPLPAYPGYEPNILMEGAKPVYIDTKDNGFKVTAKMLEDNITDKTKAIVLTYPNNPTGVCLSEKEMDKIADVIRKNNVYLLCDEIYAALAFEKFHSIAKYQDIEDKVVIISGFSKSHSMTGYRIGYMLSSSKNIANLIKASQYTTTGTATLSQYGAMVALEKCLDRSEVIKQNKERVDYMVKGLEKLGFSVIKPEGAFYVFASYSKISNKDSLSFCTEILENTHVGIVPGICFNVEGYVRLSVIKDIPELDEALNRLEKYFKGI